MQCEHADLRRNKEPDGQNACAEPTAHEQVAASLNDLSDRVTLAVTGRHDGTTEDREPHLAAVGVPGNDQADPRRKTGKQVWIVRDGQHWLVALNLAERPVDVVVTLPKVAHAGKPKVSRAPVNTNSAILQHSDPPGFKCRLDAGVIEPPIVVPETRPHSQRCMEPCQDCRCFLGWHETTAQNSVDHEVSWDQNNVRLRRVCCGDDTAKLVHAVEWGPDVQVCQDRSTDARQGRRPARYREPVLPDAKRRRLEPKPPRAEEDDEGSEYVNRTAVASHSNPSVRVGKQDAHYAAGRRSGAPLRSTTTPRILRNLARFLRASWEHTHPVFTTKTRRHRNPLACVNLRVFVVRFFFVAAPLAEKI